MRGRSEGLDDLAQAIRPTRECGGLSSKGRGSRALVTFTTGREAFHALALHKTGLEVMAVVAKVNVDDGAWKSNRGCLSLFTCNNEPGVILLPYLSMLCLLAVTHEDESS